MKIGDRVRSKRSGKEYILTEKCGRVPGNRRRVLWGVESVENGLMNAFSSSEIERV